MHNKRKKLWIILPVVIITVIVIGPMVSGFELFGNSEKTYEKNITVNITFPTEEFAYYIDAIPPQYISGGEVVVPVIVLVRVESSNGIRKVSISNGTSQSECRKDKEQVYACLNPSLFGKQSIKVTAVDNAGDSVFQLRNYSINLGQLPPPTHNPLPQNYVLSGFQYPIGILAFLIGLLIVKMRVKSN
jgi:hypothetical protein